MLDKKPGNVGLGKRRLHFRVYLEGDGQFRKGTLQTYLSFQTPRILHKYFVFFFFFVVIIVFIFVLLVFFSELALLETIGCNDVLFTFSVSNNNNNNKENAVFVLQVNAVAQMFAGRQRKACRYPKF